MEAQIKAGILKALLDATKDVCTTVNVRFTAEGISMQSMDSCHVALVSLVIYAAGFSKYNCTEATTLGLNIDSLALIIKGCAGDEEVRPLGRQELRAA